MQKNETVRVYPMEKGWVVVGRRVRYMARSPQQLRRILKQFRAGGKRTSTGVSP